MKALHGDEMLMVLLIFGTKKLRNSGSDRGAAVKGFKDGIKPEDAKAAEAADQAAVQQVAQQQATTNDPKTVDVASKEVR